MNSYYQKADLHLWKGRQSEDKAYIHQNVSALDLSPTNPIENKRKAFALLGYACDAGIRRNQGRPGAFHGPAALRSALGRMPLLRKQAKNIRDAGDVVCAENDMEGSQQLYGESILRLLQHNYFPLGVGGGHDIAYGHYTGIRKFLGSDKTLGIINFDAHLDLRRPANNGHSGSPFYQISQDCSHENIPFKYACIGVRADANPAELWERAKKLGVLCIEHRHLSEEDKLQSLQRLSDFIEPLDTLYLSIDLDGFSSAYAPGVSAASPMGFSPSDILPFLKLVLNSGKLISIDLAELSPGHDRDSQTAVLAASLIHEIIHHSALL